MHLLDLTYPEYQILQGLADGKTLKELAHERNKSLRTFETQISRAKEKNQARTLYELVGRFAVSRADYERQTGSVLPEGHSDEQGNG